MSTSPPAGRWRHQRGRTQSVASRFETVSSRLEHAGLATFAENDTSCCHALQDEVWVHGPGKEPWEVYVVKADACTLGRNAGPGTTTGDGCRTPQAAELSSASAGCGWTGTSRASAGVPFALVAFARVR